MRGLFGCSRSEIMYSIPVLSIFFLQQLWMFYTRKYDRRLLTFRLQYSRLLKPKFRKVQTAPFSSVLTYSSGLLRTKVISAKCEERSRSALRDGRECSGAITWPLVVLADPGSIPGSFSEVFDSNSQSVHLSVVWTMREVRGSGRDRWMRYELLWPHPFFKIISPFIRL